MLTELQIKNIAVIENADIEFGQGLNILTGETGAGKSIVIDALGAVIGTRVGKDMLRTGSDKGMVTAVFLTHNADSWLIDNDIDADDGEIIIQRKISADGKNSCRVCGQPVSVSQLRELGTFLLDIHGQNDGRLLLDETRHLQYLDSFGDYQNIIHKYGAIYKEYTELVRKRKKLSMDESERLRRIDTIRYAIQELSDANLVNGEEEEKTVRRDLLYNSEKISEFINNAYDDITGAEINAVDLTGEAELLLTKASSYAEDLQDISRIVNEAGNLLNDAAERISDFRSSLDYSPQEYNELESRLSFLRRLQRKYNSDENGLINLLADYSNELQELEGYQVVTEKLDMEISRQFQLCKNIADEITECRVSCANNLEKSIENELADLNMPSVRFKVCITPIDNISGLDKHGADNVFFMMSANRGEKIEHISKVASGGELSRIMLAMKNVFARNDIVDTMVFDEIDAGISGVAAQRVGEKLSDVATYKQVICVTHLAQIAVMADQHFWIEKSESDGRTYTSVNLLSEEDKKLEIARLHSGVNITDITLASAQNQIDSAKEYINKHRNNKESN